MITFKIEHADGDTLELKCKDTICSDVVYQFKHFMLGAGYAICNIEDALKEAGMVDGPRPDEDKNYTYTTDGTEHKVIDFSFLCKDENQQLWDSLKKKKDKPKKTKKVKAK